MKTLIQFAFLTSLIMLCSCKHESLFEIPEPGPMDCDTTEVSFSGTIAPILQQNCYMGCHNGTNPSSGFLLDNYNGVKAKVNEGRLYGAVARLTGYVAMPLDQDPLPDCKISQIKAWIDEGALDN